MNQTIRRRLLGAARPTLEGPAARDTSVNQGMPPGPQRLSGPLRQLLQLTPLGAIQSVREVNRYPTLIPVGVTGLAQVSTSVISTPNGRRIFFSARNSSASAAGGILFLSFGSQADAANAQFELPVGGIMVLDAVVPQGEVFAAASIAGVNVVFTYADSNL